MQLKAAAFLLALGSAGAANANLIGNPWLNGHGPLDRDAGLPAAAFHYMGDLSARWVDEHLLNPYVRRHVRDLVADRAVKDEIYPPKGCKVTLVNTLQRHGARHPSPPLSSISDVAQKLAEALKDIPDHKLADPKVGILRDLPVPAKVNDLVPYGALQYVLLLRSLCVIS